MDKNIADKILEETQNNYDSFAESFSETRNYLWPDIKRLISDNFKAGDRVLDIGCGNGRYYPLFKDEAAEYVGIDNSHNLVVIAKKKFPEANFLVGDALALPFGENKFDLAVAIAVLHHIPSKHNRWLFLNEIGRVLKPDGRVVITVWDLRLISMIRARRWKRFKNFIRTQTKILLRLEKIDHGDFFISWQNEYRRYIHVFMTGELVTLVKEAGFSIEKSGVSSFGAKEANLYIVAKKLQN